LPHAAAQAERFGAELILLRVVEPFPQVRSVSVSDLERIRSQTEEWVSDYLERLSQGPRGQGILVQTAMVEGQPHVAILQFAETHQVDLIVICTRGRSGISRWLMGSVADRIVRGAAVPVLLVRTTKGTSEIA
jgi:nucleotide-binding universal stress UspA family protein